MNPVRVLLADDHELVRRGLCSILAENRSRDWQIVGQASNGLEAIEMGESLRPEIAIVDLGMPGCSGLEVTERLVKAVMGIRVVILTMHVAAPVLRQLRKAGACAFMAKNEAPRMLVTALERVLAGEPFFASTNAYRTAREIELPEYVPSRYLLTPRELTVFRLLALGRSNKELAGDLNISVRTAESHHANILAKLNAESVGELVRIAIRDGVI
jgi:two-component system, NarL family, response regulator NreC